MTILTLGPVFTQHQTGDHPECSDRITVIQEALVEAGVTELTKPGRILPATDEQLLAVHTRPYLQSLRQFESEGGGRIDPDTVVAEGSCFTAVQAAGSLCAAVDDVMTGTEDRAFVLSRPPGHHALRNSAMGFCLLNNIAIAAEHAIHTHGLSRILIVDFDVHHGNGTQDIFYDREDVTMLSAHRFPFWPGSGEASETGTSDGIGTTFNLPVAFGTSSAEYRERFARVLDDAVAVSRPELLLISAGFDAHHADPIGSLGLDESDFSWLTRQLLEVANSECDGKLVSVLEGGYNLDVLGGCVEAHLRALLEQDDAAK